MTEQAAGSDDKNGSASSCALDSKLPGLSQLSAEDLQTVITLYQQNPNMWKDFHLVVDLVDYLHTDSWDFQTSRNYLLQVLRNRQTGRESHTRSHTHDVVLGQFCVAVGAVEAMVDLYQHICQEKGKTYVTELLPPFAADDIWCVYFLKSIFLGISCFSMEFRLRLARSGFLDFVMDDLRHMQHLSSDSLSNGGVYIESMGTLFNCCRHPEVVKMLRRKPLLQDVMPFVDKETFVIKGLALIAMAFLVEDCDLDLIQLDCDTLQYFLDTTAASFASQGLESEGWQTDAVVHGLSQFARNDVNRRRIVAQGGLKVLEQVLNGGIQVQREVVMDTLIALSRDQGNVHVIQGNRHLRQVLQQVERGDHPVLCARATTLITVLSQCLNDAESKEDSTDNSLCEFIRENSNALTILDVGEVEYVLDYLDPGSSVDIGSQSFGQVLQALLQMSRNDNKKHEIFARGGLDLLTRHLEKGDDKEKEMVLNVIETLASTSEYGEIVQSHRGLCQLTKGLMQSDNVAMSQAARRLQHAIKEVISAKGRQGTGLNKVAETP